jgi:hypothetical protein
MELIVLRRLRRLFRRRSNDGSAEAFFEQALGIGPLPRGPDHPVWNAEARRAFAEDARERLFGKCDELRAAGRWSTEMEEAWTALADSEEEDPEVGERLSALARLVNRATE